MGDLFFFMPLGNLVPSKTRLLILVQCIFQLQKQVLYEFSVASRHKARHTRFSTGIARRMFMPCRSRFGLTKLQTNWNIFLEIRKCSRQIKRINTLMKEEAKTHMRASSASPAIIQIDLVALLPSSSYLNLTHENTYHF